MAIPSVVSDNPSGKPFHKGGDAFKIRPTQLNWHSLSFHIGRESGCLATNNPDREKVDMISRQRRCDKAISLNSTFRQQSDQCSRKERFSSKNSPCL